jgi:hypothetical protein
VTPYDRNHELHKQLAGARTWSAVAACVQQHSAVLHAGDAAVCLAKLAGIRKRTLLKAQATVRVAPLLLPAHALSSLPARGSGLAALCAATLLPSAGAQTGRVPRSLGRWKGGGGVLPW